MMDIFPVVLLMIPLFQKIGEGGEAQAEMSRFEVTNTLNVLLWVVSWTFLYWLYFLRSTYMLILETSIYLIGTCSCSSGLFYFR